MLIYMSKKYFAKIFSAAIVFAVAIAVALPAQAFYIELPQIFKKVKAVSSPYGTFLLSNDEVAPVEPVPPTAGSGAAGSGSTGEPGTQPAPQPEPVPVGSVPAPKETCILRGIEVPGPCSSYGVEDSKPAQPQVEPNQQQLQINETCNINGKEMPGPCSKYNNSSEFGGGEGEGKMQGGPSPEDQARQLKNMQRGAKQMKVQLNKLTLVFQAAEKKGTVIPDEIKQKLEQAKQMAAAIDAAGSAEELEDIDMGELGQLVQDLEQARRDIIESAQRLQDMKRGMLGMEKNISMFEKQIAKLTKQNIAVPAEVIENLSKIKIIIAAIKQAKTWEEAMEAGIEDMQDLMQDLDQYRQQLEMLARWPQTIKQIERDIKQLTAALKRSKTIVNKLSKKGIDLSATYSQFEEAVNRLKTARDEAINKIKEGNAEEAFGILENDVFGQMGDIWEHQRVIDMMSNLGRFTSEFKRGIAQAQATIKKLQRKKLDTGLLEDLLSQSQTKGQGILDMIKSGDIDADLVSSELQELENLRQEFENAVSELTGEEELMPWEKGVQQFKPMALPATVQRAIPQKPAQTQEVAPPLNQPVQP